jgi:RNA recognition motif-containing protein
MENEPVRTADAAVSQKKLYVGSLPYSWTTEQLEELFRPYGRVSSAAIVTDQSTRKSKGFGFIELESDEAAKKAMGDLNGKEIEGRQLAVREARPHVERSGGGDHGGSGGGNYRDGGQTNRNQRPNYNHQSLDDTESTDTSGRGYGNRRGWW